MTAIDFTRWFLALFFVSVAAFYTIRILLLKRKMGASPVFVRQPGTLHFATHLTFRIFRVGILAVCVIRLTFTWEGIGDLASAVTIEPNLSLLGHLQSRRTP